MLNIALFEAFAEDLAERVARKLKTPPAEYDSKLVLPQGVSARAFRARCKHIVEARHEGKVWRVGREAWHASFEKTPASEESGEVDAYDRATRGRK